MLNAINWKLKYGFISLIVGVVLLITSAPRAISFMGDPIKVDSVEKVKSLKPGDHVTVDVTMADGAFMKYTEDGKETAKYYFAYFFDKENLIEHSLTVRVSKDYYSLMDDATTACDEFFEKWYEDYDTPLPTKVFLSIDGVVTEFSKQEKDTAQDLIDEGYIEAFYIAPNTRSSTFIVVIIGFVFIGVAALLIILFFLGRKKDKARLEELRTSNPGYYQAPEGVTFNNDATPQTYNGFDPSTDPRFNGLASGNPTRQTLLNGEPINGIYNEVPPTNNYEQPDTSGNFNEVPGSNNSDNNIG